MYLYLYINHGSVNDPTQPLGKLKSVHLMQPLRENNSLRVMYLVFRHTYLFYSIFKIQKPLFMPYIYLYYAIILTNVEIYDSKLPSFCVVQSVRTVKLTYAAQFDLEKSVKVRILTVLKCACTNGTEVQGEETEWVYTREPTGVAGSGIRDFHCVFYGKEYMECTWESGPVQPPNSQHYLYYWHKEMDETKECPEYIVLPEGRRGCRFPRESLLEFSNFNLCVNGSSPAGSLRTAYFSVEVQNHVKPAVVSSVHVSETAGGLKLDWSPPSGRVPEHCLEYEVESSTAMENGKEKQERMVFQNLVDTSYGLLRGVDSQKTCFRIRSKVNMYCADGGIWSDWSQTKCTDKETRYIPAWKYLSLVGLLVIGIGILCLSLWILKKICIKKINKKDALYTLYKEKVNKTMPTILSPIFK
uniref:Interleukin-13 receptor subunit alpha-2-like n=1 Tax=Sinocyclocheilus grahami TaxID=75366 RepID=A0A672PTY4_SINGR